MTSSAASAVPADPVAVAVRSMHAMADGEQADFDSLYHPRAADRENLVQPPSSRVPGPAGFHSTALWLRAAFAGLRYDIHHAIADGSLVAVTSTMNGRHVTAWAVYSEDGTPVPKAVIGKPAIGYETLASGAASLESAAAPGAGCVIFTTSGTTSAPKFVLHDQRSVAGHARNVARGVGLDGASARPLSPPLCGVSGFCSAMAALAAGRPLVMRPAWDAAQAADDIVKHRVTHANSTDEAIATAADSVERWRREGIEEAMNAYNGLDLTEPPA